MWRVVKRAFWLSAAVILLLCLCCFFSVAQQNPKRLILKDGSFQTTTKWEIKGDRVRYFSADRYDWEELPKDLVDWPATDKYNQEHEKQRSITAADIAQQEEVDRKAEETESPTVAPGLRLPNGGGVFLLDQFHGQPQLAELVQSGGEVNKQRGKNILRAALNPLALSSRQTIELKGLHAHIQAHQPQPEIYVNVEATSDGSSDSGEKSAPGKDTDVQPDRYRIVRLEQKKDSRIVGNLSIAVYGKVSEKENWIKTNSTPVGDWVKVSPAEPLERGEYALVEMLGKKQINLYVWDFGVNPDAPANSTVWTPKQPAQSPAGTDESPVFGKRPPQ
ncbi:MAG TPA: hypothetical protein VI636_08680 [Candidatus Angelobacter sp.]